MTRSDLPLIVCPECGAENNSFANVCWICRSPLYQGEEKLVDAELAPQAASPKQGTRGYGLAVGAFVLLVLGTVLVAFGMLAGNSEGMVPFLIIVVPLVVAVSAFMLRGSQSENPVVRKLSLALSALIVTIATVILLGIATIIALFAYCLMLISAS